MDASHSAAGEADETSPSTCGAAYVSFHGQRTEPIATGDARDGPLMQTKHSTEIEAQDATAEALRDSERKWREVFEHNPAMYFMVDAAGIIMAVNSFGASHLGYTVSELAGQPMLNLVLGHDKDLVQRNLTACLQTLGQSKQWEVRKIRRDGTELRIRENAKATQWSGGKPIILVTGEDVSESHRNDLELARLAAIVSSSDDAIISKTVDGTVTSWNAGATSIFGYEAHEMIGQSITRIIPTELHEEERRILMRLQRGERLQHFETVRVAKDGRHVDISLTVSPLLDKSGKIVGASKVARDITSARRAEAELQQTQSELVRVARVTTLGELTAAIAHEVNQPLTGLVNSGNACLRWLNSEPPNLEAAQRSVERMIAAGSRAAEVITRIRALIAKSPPRLDLLSMNETITEVIALIGGEVQRNRISLNTQLSKDVPLVRGDRIQLQQVILNLILNAIEAMNGVDGRRELAIASANHGLGGILVTVQDSGVGLEDTGLDRLFEPFFTTKAKGMGIGLAVSRTIINAHGGRLWASPNVPRGAKFQFILPADGGAVA
jgi:PAS domain S-box-containing protein